MNKSALRCSLALACRLAAQDSHQDARQIVAESQRRGQRQLAALRRLARSHRREFAR